MTSANSQSMKPATVAKKLGIYLPATPQEFQDSEITELLAAPPQWLVVERATHAAVRSEAKRIKEEAVKKEATKEAKTNATAKRDAPKASKRDHA